MDHSTRWLLAVYVLLLFLVKHAASGEHRQLYMVRTPEPIASPINDEVVFECEMNIKPDQIRWRHFPLSANGSDFDPPDLNTGNARYVNPKNYRVHGKKSTLTVDLNSREAAGDYQCLVTYGVSVLASVPGRVSIAEIKDFGPRQQHRYVVPMGNTVALRCDLPYSNPPAEVNYYKSNSLLNMSLILPTKTLLLENVSLNDAGTYTCSARNYISGAVKNSNSKMVLIVDNLERQMKPRFLSTPPSNYTVTEGQDVFLECSAIGNPIPTVTWSKLNGLLPKDRATVVPGGLKIHKVTSSDQGTYICSHGDLKHHIMLLFYERPVVKNLSTIDMREGKDFDADCTVSGTPDPKITWLINGESVVNDSNIEAIGNKIYFRPIEKRHAGIIQCFATNAVGTEFGFTFLKVYPKQISSIDSNATYPPSANMRPLRRRKKGRRQKKPKINQAIMIPPSKPNVTRLSDESVMVRWSVPENDGLPISFFKVQYRELGYASEMNNGGHSRGKSSRWKTTNADINPFLRSYQVDNLKPDHVYKFRIAAVYSNNDNKNGPNSAKFHLKREDFFTKNPLPAPRLTHTEPLSQTAIKIYWEYHPNPNITIEGFYVNYQPASLAGDYFKITVDGENARNYTINHLQPDTSYDIKIQSYTQNRASDFSPILKQKTLRLVTESSVPSVILVPTTQSKINDSGPQQMYIIGGIVGLAFIVLLVSIAVCVIRKRRNGDNDHGDKSGPVTEDGHHIQADSNGYLAKAVPHTLTNGCGPPRSITITANPLADADDNQVRIKT